jgi:formylglycine-generating enzyme required for sulfatase activity
MITTIKIIILAILFVATGGAIASNLFQRHKVMTFLTAFVATLGAVYLSFDIYEDIVESKVQEALQAEQNKPSLPPKVPIKIQEEQEETPPSPKVPLQTQEKQEEATPSNVVELGENTFRHRLKDGNLGPEMVWIPAGSFMMGSESGHWNEKPVHRVEVSAFAMGKYEVTRGQFRQFIEATGYKTEAETDDGCYGWTGDTWEQRAEFTWRDVGFSQEDTHPVVCISWNDAVAYTRWLTEKTGKTYRLPTEAEWEYAARAQTETERFWGNNPDEACRYANVADKTSQKQFSDWTIHNCTDGYTFTAPVGFFEPNEFKLYDMLGNVWEWCEDTWHGDYEDAPTDGSAWLTGDSEDLRGLRGGSWNFEPDWVRSAYRDLGPTLLFRFYDLGFRVVLFPL